MLMQCAITSGLRRPRNLSRSCRPPARPPLLQEGGLFSTWGGGGGGEAEGKQRAASGGMQAVEPSPQAGPGGREGELGRGRERASLGRRRRGPQHKEEVVLPPSTSNALPLHPAGLVSSPLSP